jgi:hypothetical protein
MTHSPDTYTTHFDKYFALLIAGVVVASLGVWDARIPLGDEGGYILQALSLASAKTYSSNLYLSAYAFLFRTVTDDPIIAHLIMRFVGTLISTIGMYFVLTAFKSISRLAVMIACLIWASSSYANAYSQSSSVNVFTLALILPGIAALLRYPTINGLFMFMFAAFWAAKVRPEYYAAFIMVSLCGGVMIARQRTYACMSRSSLISAVALCALLATSVWATGTTTDTGKTTDKGEHFSLDEYLLLGLGQCYGVYYKEHHPSEHFDAMTEYRPILDKVFGHPKGFAEAIKNNPSEIIKYFVLNGASNIAQIIPTVAISKSVAKSILANVMLVLGTIFGLLYKQKSAPSTEPAQRSWLTLGTLKVLTLLALATSSSVAIVLLIPDHRYWISCMPLLYLWLAWAIDRFLDIKQVKAYHRIAVIVILVTMGIPHLLFHANPKKPPNQEMLYMMRESAKGLSHDPVIAGNFATPWAAFAFRGHATAINTKNGLSPEDLKKHRYDFFISTGLEESAKWQAEQSFLSEFKASPERFGYREFKFSNGVGTDVYVRTE